MKKSKLLTALFALFIIVPCAFLFVACGGNKDQNKDQEKTVSSIMVSVASNSKYYQYYDGARFNLSSTDWDFTKDDFVVKIFYSDGSEEESLNYTLYVDEDFSWQEIDANCYSIHFIYDNQEFADLTIRVVIEDEILPSLTGITKVGEEYYLDQELHYTGEEQNSIGFIGTADDGVTLQTLIDENKVNVSSSSTTVATNANVYYNDEYDYNTILLEACDGYTWEIGNEKVKDIVIKWNIKRQIFKNNPIVTSRTEYTYEYTDQNGYIEGFERGLTFDYKDYEGLVYSNDAKACDAGEYTWELLLYDDRNYAFLSGDQEVNSLTYNWKIVPKKLSINAVEITDTANKVGEYYRYTYTGDVIKPNLNIDSGVPNIFYVDYGNSGWAYSKAYNVSISVDTNLYHDSNGLINFVWANGDAISINYKAKLPFFIDKKQVEAPSDFDASKVAFLEQEYRENGNYLHHFNLTSEAEHTSFTSETLSYLNNLQMLNNNAVFKWQDQNQSLSVGNNNAVLYWYSNSEGAYEDNYIPLEIEVIVTINKAKAVVSPYWEQDSNTSVYSIKRLDNSNVEDLVNKITYTYYYGETGYSTTNVATNLTDAGYYTVVATLPDDKHYELVLGKGASFTAQWIIEKTEFYLTNYESEMWSLSDGTSSTNNLDSYYYENEGNAVNKVVSINEAKLTVDAQSLLNVTTTHYFLNGSTWVETTNCSAVGQYKSVATFTFKEGHKASNYIVYGATETENGLEVSVIWNIYPNSYELITTDSSAENYIGWQTGVQTEFIYDGTAKQPEIENVPSGLKILYDWSGIDDIYIRDSYGRSDVGTYLIKAYLAVNKNLLGYDKVTVTVDSKTYLEAGQRVEYDSEGVEVVPRRELEANGYFYYIGSLEYKIYQENFFTTGKTFTITDVIARTTDGSAVSAEVSTEVTNIKSANVNNTIILGEDGSVTGTCCLSAEEGETYTYSASKGTLTLKNDAIPSTEYDGGMINVSTLWLIKQVDTNTQIIYVFTC